MVSIKQVAAGLSKQIADAIEGKADATQADVLCKSVDTLIRLARLQIEMGTVDWTHAGHKPVLEMERADDLPIISQPKTGKPHDPALPQVIPADPETAAPKYTVATMGAAEEPDLRAEIKRMEVELAHAERDAAKAADGDGNFAKCDRHCKTLRKYILSLRDELAER